MPLANEGSSNGGIPSNNSSSFASKLPEGLVADYKRLLQISIEIFQNNFVSIISSSEPANESNDFCIAAVLEPLGAPKEQRPGRQADDRVIRYV